MIQEYFLETSLGQIYGRAAGVPERELIIGLHGWSQRNGWHTWGEVLEPLASADYFAFSFDMPGWGKTPALHESPISTREAISVVLAVMASFDKDNTVLFGKSWGGGVAIEAGIRYPGTITKLVLTAPAYRNLEKLKKLQIPVMLVWSEDDPVIPFQFAQLFLDAIPDCRLVSYETGGHSAAMKNIDDFSPKVIEFLAN